MSRREKGSFGLLDNLVLAYIKRNHNASAGVLTALAERDNYTHLPAEMKVAELMLETDLGQRAVEKCLAKLAAEGLAARGENGWMYNGANCRANRVTNGRANDCSLREGEKADQDSVADPLKDLEGIKEDISLPPSRNLEGNEGEADASTDEGGPGPDHLRTRSPENPGTATLAGGAGHPVALTPPVPPPPPSPADLYTAALRFFDGLAGYSFAMSNSQHITRWYEEYSEAFLRLAWKLAPGVKAARIPRSAFVFLLQRTQPWPEELRRQYLADTRAGDTEDGGGDAPYVGQIRVMKDGRSGPVLEVNHTDRRLTLQVGADLSESLDVLWKVTEPAVRRSA